MRRLLPLLAVLTLFPAAAAGARTNVLIGMGDQSPSMLKAKAYKRLHMHHVRYLVTWKVMWKSRSWELDRARAYAKLAHKTHQRVFLHITTDDYRIKKGKLPSQRAYRKNVTRIVKYFRKLGVREFGSWNEVNHTSEPTWNHPKAAAHFFRSMRSIVHKRCKGCKVVGLDLLDQRGTGRYIRRFVHYLGRSYARRHLTVIGVHNYADVNRKRTSGLRGIIRATRHALHRTPHFWLTETGGIVKFAKSFKCSTKRAAKRLGYLFKITRRYRHYLQRVYLYNWYGTGCHSRFDAGLTTKKGKPRKGYYVVRKRVKGFRH